MNGFPGAVINESNLRYTPFSGGEIGGTYEGPDAAIQAAIVPLFNFGYEVVYKKSKSPFSTLQIRACWNVGNGITPTNPSNDYLDTWELVRNTTQKELLESDHPLVGGISSSDMGLIKQIFNGSIPLEDNDADLDQFLGNKYGFDGTGTLPPGVTVDQAVNNAVYLAELWSSGVKTIPVKQPILRLTRTTNPLYSTPFNVSNVDTILTTQSMIFDSGVPSNFSIPLINLAQTLVNKTILIPGTLQQYRTDGLFLFFGWKKDLISNNKHGNKRIQYILQYEFGLWDAILYGVPQ